MPVDYIVSPEAQEDYRNSVQYYLERSINAAEGFEEEFNQTLARICANPLRYPNIRAYYHEVSMRHYPYKIVYYVDDEIPVVVVSRIYHHSRNPDTKYPA